MCTNRLTRLALSLLLALPVFSVHAQESKTDVRFSAVRTSAGGAHAYAPDRWGSLQLIVANLREEPQDLLCATYFDGNSGQQYGHRVWLPARSKLRTRQTVLIPQRTPEQGTTLNFRTLLLSESENTEVIHRDESGQMLHDSAINIQHGGMITGYISPTTGELPTAIEKGIVLAQACRVHLQLDMRMAQLSDTFLIDESSSLNALDHLIILSNRIADDQRALEAVRQWTHEGGRLWIQLDLTGPEMVQYLFGDAIRLHVFDRVGLTDFRVDSHIERLRPQQTPDQHHEIPVDLVRCAVTHAQTTHSVNGWPAAISIPYGEGRIIITTLGARGWMIDQFATVNLKENATDRTPQQSNFRYQPIMEMGEIAEQIFVAKPSELLSPETLETHTRDYIGYEVPRKQLVTSILLLTLISLGIAGVVLVRLGRAEILGWIGPLFGVVAALMLVGVGRTTRHSTADTIASFQHQLPMPGTDDVRCDGITLVYRGEGSSRPIESLNGGRLVPNMKGLEGSVRRMVWSDLDDWKWERIPQQAGVGVNLFSGLMFSNTGRNVPSEHHNSAAESNHEPEPAFPQQITATFDAQGIRGIVDNAHTLSDIAIVSRDGRIGVSIAPDNSFSAPATSVMGHDQYLAAELLGDEQGRRQKTLKMMLNNRHRRDYPIHPVLMGWTPPQRTGLSFGMDLSVRGTSLVSIPIVFKRPKTTDEFVIPSPLLPYRNANSPDGSPTSAMWSHAQKQWQERSSPSSTWLNFQLPVEVLPVLATRGTLEVVVTGPVGLIEILGLKSGKIVPLAATKDPVGTLRYSINDPEVLSVTENGSILLGIRAGDPSRPELTRSTNSGIEKINYWRIESLALEIGARIIRQDD